jgi:pimeloyl-ACP methyl ester carboxylesterase
MIPTKEITEKVFTVRKPSYSKKQSSNAIEAEKQLNEILGRSDIELTANPDNSKKPIVLFVHGFAASKYCWLDPDIGNWGWIKDYKNNPKPIDFGWHVIPPPPFIIVDWTMSEQLVPKGATEIMDNKNIEWITYSQESAFSDIEDSVKELTEIVKKITKIFGKREIIIIAHSRGGLISKRYLDITPNTSVRKLITFGSPFNGTYISSLDIFQLPTKFALNKVRSLRKLWDYGQDRKAESVSTKQMKPDSDFLNELKNNGCRKDISYVNIAGSSSHITNVYAWRWNISSLKRNYKLAKKKMKEREKLIKQGKPPIDWYNLPKDSFFHVYNWILEPKNFLRIYPKVGYPEVLQGDGCVSIRSALIDEDSVKHYIIHRNHLDMTCCEEAYQIMLREVKNNQKAK